MNEALLETPSIILITGIMAAGKSTVAQALAERLPKSVHLRGDLFRRMIVNGQAEIGFALSQDAIAQLNLRYSIAANVAQQYLAAGFTVVYQDIILGSMLTAIVEQLRSRLLYLIVLCPSSASVAGREQNRGKRGYGSESEIANFDHYLHEQTPHIGLWLDTTHLTVDETVEQILSQWAEAKVDCENSTQTQNSQNELESIFMPDWT